MWNPKSHFLKSFLNKYKFVRMNTVRSAGKLWIYATVKLGQTASSATEIKF